MCARLLKESFFGCPFPYSAAGAPVAFSAQLGFSAQLPFAMEVCSPLDENSQMQWRLFWLRLVMTRSDRASQGRDMLDEYTELLLQTSPFVPGRRSASDPPGDQPAAPDFICTEAVMLSHMDWVMRMLAATIPATHADIVRRGLLAGEGDRLLVGSLRFSHFIDLANRAAACIRTPNCLIFACADDGSHVTVEVVRRQGVTIEVVDLPDDYDPALSQSYPDSDEFTPDMSGAISDSD